MNRLLLVLALAACGRAGGSQSGDAGGGGRMDSAIGGHDGSVHLDSGGGGSDGSGGSGSDGGVHLDSGGQHDAPMGVISGGPCASGTAGATAFRIRWGNAQGEAYVIYEVDGLPQGSGDLAGAYGYQIGFTPEFVDPFLGDGGLQLDDSDFVDLQLSTAGVSQIAQATLSIYGRSLDVTTSGSFNWQTFVGLGSSPTDSVSNVPPYQWYSADMTTEIAPNDSGTLIRIKAGPSSGVLVVNQIELCLVAS